jgi:hypothetical protein
MWKIDPIQTYYVYIEIYTERVSQSGTGRGDQGEGKEGKNKNHLI